jgi:hypothetical protein
MDKNIIEQAITNMTSTSEAIEKYCNDPKNYNSYAAQLLERMSWDLQKQANELKEINYLYVS